MITDPRPVVVPTTPLLTEKSDLEGNRCAVIIPIKVKAKALLGITTSLRKVTRLRKMVRGAVVGKKLFWRGSWN
jgi:hypothetical protein